MGKKKRGFKAPSDPKETEITVDESELFRDEIDEELMTKDFVRLVWKYDYTIYYIFLILCCR